VANVFREVASGAKTERAQLRRVLAQLDAGDVLIVTRFDRLARPTRDLLNRLAATTDQESRFFWLGDSWADSLAGKPRIGAQRNAHRLFAAPMRHDFPRSGAPMRLAL
jgi:hypothetical protein